MKTSSVRAFAAVILTLTSGARAAAQSIPVHVEIPAPPMAVAADGGQHVAYEMHITNFGTRPLLLTQLEVLAPGDTAAVLARYIGEELTQVIAPVGPAADSANPRLLPPGNRLVVFVWAMQKQRGALDSLVHRITVSGPAGDRVRRMTLRPTPVRSGVPAVLGPPLRGGRWLAGDGPSNVSPHRRTLIPWGGRVRAPQRFGTDWLPFGPDGRLWRGDRSRNESWYGYGSEVLAVADGVVIDVRDDMPDNTPPDVAEGLTLDKAGGNQFVLDLGGGRYALYAPLRPGRRRGRPGDRVSRGQVLGEVGNSGNSTAPHLHFHLVDSPEPFAGEGLPYVFGSYVREGRAPESLERYEEGAQWKGGERPDTRRGEIPLMGEVIRF